MHLTSGHGYQHEMTSMLQNLGTKNASAAEELLPNMEVLDMFNWKSSIWTIKTSPKTKMLLWKAAQNALPIGENLLFRNVSDAVKCPHCGEEESTLHLLFKCPFASQVWNLAPFKDALAIEEINFVREGITLASKLLCLPPSGIGEGRLSPWLFWTILTFRNQLIFSKKEIPAS